MSDHPQENTLTWPETTLRCANLRSKQFYMDMPFHPSGLESGVPVPCWCFKTQKMMGPDGDIASESDCTTERECFEKG